MLKTTAASLIALLPLVQLVSAQSGAYGQCGGIGWTGATTCVSGYTCVYSNDYYSQCQPGTGSTSSTASTSTTKASTSTTKTTTSTSSTSTASGACTVTSYSQVANAVSSCTNIAINGISVPAGTTLDLTKVKTGTTITFSGTTTFGYKEWAGPLISVAGTGITVQGTGTLDGLGGQYWDGEGSNGGKTKPKFFYAHKMINSKITGITVKNSPVQVFSVNGAQSLTIDGVTVDDSAGDSGGGHNTDAFDIGSSSYITVQNSKIYNQDDCIAVNSGTNIYVSNLYCSGGHGLSIGSVGGRDDNTVSNVTFINSQVVNSQNGARIKTVYGATGQVSDITYSGITLSNVNKYGVVIEQDYENGSPTGTPTAGVPITGLTLKGITGTVTSSAKDYYILCASGACSNWSFSGVSVTGGKSNSCNYKPSGFSC